MPMLLLLNLTIASKETPMNYSRLHGIVDGVRTERVLLVKVQYLACRVTYELYQGLYIALLRNGRKILLTISCCWIVG